MILTEVNYDKYEYYQFWISFLLNKCNKIIFIDLQNINVMSCLFYTTHNSSFFILKEVRKYFLLQVINLNGNKKCFVEVDNRQHSSEFDFFVRVCPGAYTASLKEDWKLLIKMHNKNMQICLKNKAT